MVRFFKFLCRSFLPILLLTLLGVPGQLALAGSKHAAFDEQGRLLLPHDYRTWVYVGGSVTPNEMNKGQAAFPEFHNVYMDPESYQEFKETGTFPDGTVMIKETLGIGGKSAESGNGYFMGDFIGLFAGVKDSKRFVEEPDHWAFFTFRESAGEKMKKSAEALPAQACSSCHQAGANERVFTQYYPILKKN
jgi:hypothetical protein